MGKVKCIYCHKLPKEWICISSRLKKMYFYKCPMCGMSTRKRKTREKALKEWNKTNGGLLGKLMEVNYKLCHDTIIFHPAYYLNEIREHYNMSKEAFATDIAVRSKASDTETGNKVFETESEAFETESEAFETESEAFDFMGVIFFLGF